MTWTATELGEHSDWPVITTHIKDQDGQIFCQLNARADDHAAIEQMRARARLIVQAEAMLGMLKVVLDWVSNWDPNFADDDEWIEDRDAIRAIIKATGGEE